MYVPFCCYHHGVRLTSHFLYLVLFAIRSCTHVFWWQNQVYYWVNINLVQSLQWKDRYHPIIHWYRYQMLTPMLLIYGFTQLEQDMHMFILMWFFRYLNAISCNHFKFLSLQPGPLRRCCFNMFVDFWSIVITFTDVRVSYEVKP